MNEKILTDIGYRDIALEIYNMYQADQAMRKRQLIEEDFWDEDLDRKNTERMKEIISKIGWPTKSKVGESISNNAWLLVQHADHDVTFQEMCLGLMKSLPPGEVENRDIAYLEDRVRVNKGQFQLYGTQFTVKDGKRVPKPIEDEDVDERRSRMGLNSIDEYTKEMYEFYGIPKKNE